MDFRELREKCGFDRKNKFALCADMSRQHLDQIESGAAMPSLEVAYRMACLLNKTMDEVTDAIFISRANAKKKAATPRPSNVTA